MLRKLGSIIHNCSMKKKEKFQRKMIKKDDSSLFSYIINLAHIHAISNLAVDWTHSREGSLKRRRMELRIPSALKSTTIIGGILCLKLPSDTSHSLFLCLCKGENLPACSATGAMVIIQDSLVTVFVTYVSQSCEFAAVHISTNTFIFTFPVAFVNRNWPISA